MGKNKQKKISATRRYITLSTAIASQIRAKRREHLQTTGNLVTYFFLSKKTIFLIFAYNAKNVGACFNTLNPESSSSNDG